MVVQHAQVYDVQIRTEDEYQQWNKLIGTNLRALRRKHGLTLNQVAQEANISISHLANAEQGRRSIGGEQLRRILQCYGYSLGVFCTHIKLLLGSEDGFAEPASDAEIIEHSPIPLIGRHNQEPHLLLLRPTPSTDEPEHLLLILPPGTELWRSYLVLPCRSSVAVAHGVLLVETKHREYALHASEYLSIPAEVPHRFRNHTRSETRAYIWVESAWL
ncbi:MAG: XRE family transcriptional regulator [Candidatus Kapaibacterium sp.]|nr:MAG: XRE family transcriptional regulator [Candidatus Kapabacteria bacterium]